MKKDFFKKILLISFPFIIILIIPFIILIYSGELSSDEEISELQGKSKKLILYGKTYTQDDSHYKLLSVQKRNPEIIALGTSRILMIRKEFFNDTVKFFNAGGGLSKITGYYDFINSIDKEKQPKVILAGFDQNFFNIKWHKTYILEDRRSKLKNEEKKWKVIIDNWKNVYSDYYNSYFSLDNIFSNKETDEINKVGIDALQYNTGYRNDGSRSYGNIKSHYLNPNSPDYGFKKTFSEIESFGSRFIEGEEISDTIIYYTKRFLDLCKSRGIYVIGFLPPYPPSVFLKMEKKFDKELKYIPLIKPELDKLFSNYGYYVYDFTNSGIYGITDNESLDGIHCNEKAYLKLFIFMAERDNILRKYIDVDRLRKDLSQSGNDINIY